VTQPIARPGDSLTRVAFRGTPDVAVPTLRALHAAGFEIPLVVTRPDRRRGRGGALSPSPVKEAAVELGLEVTDDLSALEHVAVDIAVVVAYGRIIPLALLQRIPMVNLHFSLLPRWRGAAPVERAILAGDRTTGVCLMQVAEGLDTGDILLRAQTPIEPEEMAGELFERLAPFGAELLVRTLAQLDTIVPQPQPEEGVTHAAMLEKEMGRLDLTKPAVELHRRVRGLSPWPGTTLAWGNEALKVLKVRVAEGAAAPGTVLPGARVACGEGALELVEVQAPGKRAVSGADFLNGARIKVGDRLG